MDVRTLDPAWISRPTASFCSNPLRTDKVEASCTIVRHEHLGSPTSAMTRKRPSLTPVYSWMLRSVFAEHLGTADADEHECEGADESAS
jgi:hypothetical protein